MFGSKPEPTLIRASFYTETLGPKIFYRAAWNADA